MSCARWAYLWPGVAIATGLALAVAVWALRSTAGAGDSPAPKRGATRLHEEWIKEWAEAQPGADFVSVEGTPDLRGVPSMLRRRKDSQVMVLVPSGSFDMGFGSNAPSGPVHRVRITRAFYVDVSEVTLGQFNRFSTEARSHLEALGGDTGDSQPAENVTFEEALKYAASVGADLPTEAEWEWAARRKSGFKYPWGNDFEVSRANVRGGEDGFDLAAPIRSFPPSTHGIYDLCGNVAEWCLDYMDGAYYMSSPVDNPRNDLERPARVMRGGDYGRDQGVCTTYHRIPGRPDVRYIGAGFRCVVRLPK